MKRTLPCPPSQSSSLESEEHGCSLYHLHTFLHFQYAISLVYVDHMCRSSLILLLCFKLDFGDLWKMY